MNNFNEALRQLEDNVTMKYLTFMIGSQHYGISIENVIEIVQLQPVTQIPELPPFIKGIINLRGQVVSLMDMNLRFGNPERKYTERTCVIIVDFDGSNMGLIVDEVEEVMDIDNSQIIPPPSFSADDMAGYVSGIGNLDRYMVLLLNSRLLSNYDMDDLVQSAV